MKYNDALISQMGGLGVNERRNFVSSDVYKKIQLMKDMAALFNNLRNNLLERSLLHCFVLFYQKKSNQLKEKFVFLFFVFLLY